MNKLKFFACSLLGFIFFLVPLEIAGESKIAISHIVNFITGNMYNEFISFTMICAVIVIAGTVLSAYYTSKFELINDLFKTSFLGGLVRILGSIMYLMVLNGWFPNNPLAQLIIEPNTGGVMAGNGGLLTTLYITFFVGIMALPLLTHFGAVEFLGIILGKFVRKLFKVPGYSAVDAIASFVGDGTIGIVVTDSQYQRGYYNKREAFIIASSFSIVGIAFASAVAEELGFAHIFPVFYGSIAVVTIVLAMITARMPLKNYAATYYEDVTPNTISRPSDKSLLAYALESAEKEAAKANLLEILGQSFKGVLSIYIGFLPIIMFVGTLSLVIAEHTTFFNIISAPLVIVYKMIGYSAEVSSAMAPASLVGFADMYLPSLFIGHVSSESARFFIGVLAFTQLIFMSETGMVLVKTKIGVSFIDVIKIFLFRTVLSIPLLVLLTRGLVLLGVIGF
jgi:nucleoside recognition membrane protein YjiH